MLSFGDAKDRSSELEANRAGRADRDATGIPEVRSGNDRSVTAPLSLSPSPCSQSNPIIRWLNAEAMTHGRGWYVAYFERLADLDRESQEAEATELPLGQRFAAALLVDFAERHGLSVDELSTLMSNVSPRIGEAVRHLVEQATTALDIADGQTVDPNLDGWAMPVVGSCSADPDAELDDEMLCYRRELAAVPPVSLTKAPI